jgi:hypothetical protein
VHELVSYIINLKIRCSKNPKNHTTNLLA